MRVPLVVIASTSIALSLGAQQSPTPPLDGGLAWAEVQAALGGKGAIQPGGVLKFSFPRSDLQVMAAGVQVTPPLALGSWIAFKRMGATPAASTMVMGDLVLTEDEIEPVMLALQQGGIEQTAVHNHLLHETPRIMYMHITAHGDAAKIASSIRTALTQSATPLPALAGSAPSTAAAASGGTAPVPSPIDIDTAAIARALGATGKVNGEVYQVSVPRRQRITDHGMEIPPSMGVATAINFQPTGAGKAAISGDFVMVSSEVNPVIRALREHGIEVTALHSHMLTESPRLFFMHFWANDDAVTLARGLAAALDAMAVKRAVGH